MSIFYNLSHPYFVFFFFFFNDTATTEIYTLSLHDALPIYGTPSAVLTGSTNFSINSLYAQHNHVVVRSEEHTSELQSLAYLVCRLLLEKKKKKITKLIDIEKKKKNKKNK